MFFVLKIINNYNSFEKGRNEMKKKQNIENVTYVVLYRYIFK